MSTDRKVEIILGPPGTGKTTRLLRLLGKYLDAGGQPDRVAYVSFSRAAIREVIRRLGRDEEEFPYFRTIHSTAYHFLDLHRDDVLQRKHWSIFSELVGLPLTAAGHDEPMWDGTTGDKCLALYSLARSRGTDLETQWRLAMMGNLPLDTLKDVIKQYEKFKSRNALLDFHDMITRADGELPVDVLFVDEAQDTSRAQWAFLRKISAHVPRIILAGDDDQAVYAWSGADESALRRFHGTRHVLPESFRLPLAVKTMADEVIARVKNRLPKEFRPRVDEKTGEIVQGEVTWRNDTATLDLRSKNPKDTWLLLARSRYQLEDYRELARSQGVVYTLPDGEWSNTLPAVRAAVIYERLRRGQEATRAEVRNMQNFTLDVVTKIPPVSLWEHIFNEESKSKNWMQGLPHISPSDREYIRALRQGGESVTHEGRVRIGTVHSAKGLEAKQVVLKSDISERVAHGARIDPDAELRVQYVGMTRASQALHVILPSTATHWQF